MLGGNYLSLLKNRQFMFLISGRLLTNIADSLYYVAAMWIVYDLTKDPFYTGIAGFLTSFPMALQFLVGPLVDRWRVKQILVWTQFIQFLCILLIPILHFAGVLNVYWILVLLPIASTIQQFAYPAQSKALPLVVEKDQLLKANSSFSFVYQGIDFILNAVSGIIIAAIGAISLFLFDAVLFAMTTLLFMFLTLQTVQNSDEIREKKPYFSELKIGVKYVGSSILGLFTIGAICANLAIGGLMALLPVYSAKMGGAEVYGYYLAAMSIGGIAGAALAPLFGKYKMGKIYILSYFIAVIMFVWTVFTNNLIVSLIAFTMIWVSTGTTRIFVPSLIQKLVPNFMLGRVLSVQVSASTMSIPIGSLIFGALAKSVDIQYALLLCCIPFVLVLLVWSLLPTLRNMTTIEHIDEETLRLPVLN